MSYTGLKVAGRDLGPAVPMSGLKGKVTPTGSSEYRSMERAATQCGGCCDQRHSFAEVTEAKLPDAHQLMYVSPLYYYVIASYGILRKGAGQDVLQVSVLGILMLGGIVADSGFGGSVANSIKSIHVLGSSQIVLYWSARLEVIWPSQSYSRLTPCFLRSGWCAFARLLARSPESAVLACLR